MEDHDLLLEVKNLKTYFFLDEGIVKAIDGVDLSIKRGKTLCVVGESGCGKSVTAHSITQLIEPPGRVVEGNITYYPPTGPAVDIAGMEPHGIEIRHIRGEEISMIFQEPMTSLSPVHTIGNQIMESLLYHKQVTKQQARQRVIELLDRVGLPNPENRIDDYPFQLSGGMRQRAMIAMALACNPSLLIADEPTTALDVTTQAQILDLLRELQREFGMAIMLITHDLGVVAEMADDVAVMYLGQIVEQGDVVSIFHEPKHPYTQALLRSIPRIGRKARKRLDAIEGMVPDPYNRPSGCPFHPRCDQMIEGVCERIVPPAISVGDQKQVRCVLYLDDIETNKLGQDVTNVKEETHG